MNKWKNNADRERSIMMVVEVMIAVALITICVGLFLNLVSAEHERQEGLAQSRFVQ